MKDSSAMCDAFKVLTNVPCASIVKPCFYKPQTVPICPFSSCKICQPKPNRCGCCKVCQQISTPPPFPFEGDPCPTDNDEPIRVSPFTKPSACLKKSNSMRPSCIKMLEVHPVGRYVKLYNASLNKTECIGNWYLIQYNYGSTLSVFKFPKDAVVPPQYRIKVWSSCSDPGWLKLPTDHSFHELSFWCFGPGITTALYKPDGKPITWLVGLEKFEPAPCYITYDSPVRKISESGCKCCA